MNWVDTLTAIIFKKPKEQGQPPIPSETSVLNPQGTDGNQTLMPKLQEDQSNLVDLGNEQQEEATKEQLTEIINTQRKGVRQIEDGFDQIKEKNEQLIEANEELKKQSKQVEIELRQYSDFARRQNPPEAIKQARNAIAQLNKAKRAIDDGIKKNTASLSYLTKEDQKMKKELIILKEALAENEGILKKVESGGIASIKIRSGKEFAQNRGAEVKTQNIPNHPQAIPTGQNPLSVDSAMNSDIPAQVSGPMNIDGLQQPVSQTPPQPQSPDDEYWGKGKM